MENIEKILNDSYGGSFIERVGSNKKGEWIV